MLPVRPVWWAAAVALLTASCSAQPSPPTTPQPPDPPPAPVSAPPTPSQSRPATPVEPEPPPQPSAPPPRLVRFDPQPPAVLAQTPGAAAAPAAPQLPPGTTVPPGTTTPPAPPPPPPGSPAAPPSTATPSPAAGQPGAMTPPAATTPAKEEKPKWPTTVNGRSLGEWLTDFKSPDPTVRDSAVKVIPLFGPDARKIAPKELIKLIDDPDPGIRINAMLILGAVGFEDKKDVHAAARAMAALVGKTAPGSMIRLHAARTLAGIGPEAYSPEVISAINGIANDPSWETRQAVAAALGRLGAPVYDDKPPPPGPYKPPALKRPASKPAMDKLVFALLKDPSAAVRMEAMQSMIVLGPPYTADPAAYPKLVAKYLEEIDQRLKTEKDPGVRIWLMVVQMMYDNRTIRDDTKKIAEYLSGTDDNLKVQALNALAVLGPLAKEVKEEIAECLKMKPAEVPAAAIACILAMGDTGRYALADLEQLEKTTDSKDLKKLAEEAIKTLKTLKNEVAAPPKKK